MDVPKEMHARREPPGSMVGMVGGVNLGPTGDTTVSTLGVLANVTIEGGYVGQIGPTTLPLLGTLASTMD